MEAAREPLNRHAGFCEAAIDDGPPDFERVRRCVGALNHFGGHIYEGDTTDEVAVSIIRGDSK